MGSAGDILDFWFGARGSPERGTLRAEWFRKDAQFDEEIRRRFGDLYAAAARGEFDDWHKSPETLLALVIVLDQFSRNLFRNDPRSWLQDERALGFAKLALVYGNDARIGPVERLFLYLPFEHSENLEDQERAVLLMASLEAFEETRGFTQWAEKHRDVVKRFGRFPHRNAALGRISTPEEIEFLKEPGSRF
jgi:uncharacterized protein (DUF924 family)